MCCISPWIHYHLNPPLSILIFIRQFRFDFSTPINTNMRHGHEYTHKEVEEYTADKKDLVGVHNQILREYNIDSIDPKKLTFRYELVTDKKLTDKIKQIHKTFKKNPDDIRRIEEIRKNLKLLPIFMRDRKDEYIIMEGYHRAVAYYLEGITTYPVFFVSIHDDILSLKSILSMIRLILDKY